jgi:predicted RNA-binding protein with PIN domain
VFDQRSICVESRLGTVVRVSADPAADVPDEVLRPALELAIGLAATGAKMRPPIAFPVELKRFLRSQKLPPAALAQVRAAVEGDDDFRKHLASRATTDLVDEVGILWLSRPDGWTQAIAELMPERVVEGETALRRAETRRLAAEEAAERRRAQLRGLTVELERERASQSAMSAEHDRLRVELDEVRARLREAQRAEHAAVQSLAKAESELVGLRRVASEPTPLPPPVIDSATVRRLIGEAVTASTDATRVLSAALDELTKAESQPEPEAATARPTRARRKPIRLPGGVLAGSIEAAEILLRTKGARTLIDGYNVAMLGWPALDLDHQRDQCILAVENMAKRWNMAMTIVFDGASIEGAHTHTRRRVRIVYSPAGVSADDILRAEVAAVDVSKPVVVVTNDRAIITDVVAVGANTVSSDDLLTLLRR